MNHGALQCVWSSVHGDLRRRLHPDLANLRSYRQAFVNGALQIMARANVRGLDALPSDPDSEEANSEEAKILALRTAKAALAGAKNRPRRAR